MKVLVTGGAGFIGSNFVREAANGQFPELSSIIVLDKLTYAANLSHLSNLGSAVDFDFIEGDVCDPKIVNKLVSECDAIINFAAESHVDRSIKDSSHFIKSNIIGVQVLLEAIKNGLERKRFLQVSTDEVYGSINSGSWDESEILKPNSPYAATKASADLIAQAYAKTYMMDIVITRCSNNFGPRQHPEKLIPTLITNILNGRSLPIYGDGLNRRDWLYVSDHCRALYMALMKGKSGEIYNIGGGTELSNLEVAKMILREMNASEELIEFVQDRPGHDFRYSVNFEKARVQLGYTPECQFQLKLLETIEWYKENEKN